MTSPPRGGGNRVDLVGAREARLVCRSDHAVLEIDGHFERQAAARRLATGLACCPWCSCEPSGIRNAGSGWVGSRRRRAATLAVAAGSEPMRRCRPFAAAVATTMVSECLISRAPCRPSGNTRAAARRAGTAAPADRDRQVRNRDSRWRRIVIARRQQAADATAAPAMAPTARAPQPQHPRQRASAGFGASVAAVRRRQRDATDSRSPMSGSHSTCLPLVIGRVTMLCSRIIPPPIDATGVKRSLNGFLSCCLTEMQQCKSPHGIGQTFLVPIESARNAIGRPACHLG